MHNMNLTRNKNKQHTQKIVPQQKIQSHAHTHTDGNGVPANCCRWHLPTASDRSVRPTPTKPRPACVCRETHRWGGRRHSNVGEQQLRGKREGGTQTTKRVVHIEQTPSSDIFLGNWSQTKNSAGAVLGQDFYLVWID
jgi:hypothetical protein